MMRRALEDWSNSSIKKTNHSFTSCEPDNQPIRHLSEQPISWRQRTQPNTALVEPVNRPWNTTVILAELKCVMSSYLFKKKIRFDFVRKFHVSKICVIVANGENTLNRSPLLQPLVGCWRLLKMFSVTVVNSEKKTNIRPSSQNLSFSYRIEGVKSRVPHHERATSFGEAEREDVWRRGRERVRRRWHPPSSKLNFACREGLVLHDHGAA